MSKPLTFGTTKLEEGAAHPRALYERMAGEITQWNQHSLAGWEVQKVVIWLAEQWVEAQQQRDQAADAFKTSSTKVSRQIGAANARATKSQKQLKKAQATILKLGNDLALEIQERQALEQTIVGLEATSDDSEA